MNDGKFSASIEGIYVIQLKNIKMKKQQGFAWIGLFPILLLFSCVNADYHLSDINKDCVISYDKGLFIPIGSLDTVRFQEISLSIPVEVTYIKTVEGLFSNDFYKHFVISITGKEEPLGELTLSGGFEPGITNAASKEFSDITVSTQLLKLNGDNTGIDVKDQQFQPTGTGQLYNIVIKKEDVLKLKDAYTLRIAYYFSSKKVEKSDYMLIKNIKVKSSGGIRINWE